TLRTVRHELLHVYIESETRAALPLWFREGLVEYLAGERGRDTLRPSDSDLRQTADPVRARRAYAAAAGAVAKLVQHYGLDTVLAWLKSGLPREVTNTSASHHTTNSK